MRRIDNSVLLTELLEAIADGSMDQHEQTIRDALRRRETMRGMTKIATIQVGDKVVFNDKVHPAYLTGFPCTVVKVNQTTVSVRIDESHRARAGKWGLGTTKCPINMVNKVQ